MTTRQPDDAWDFVRPDNDDEDPDAHPDPEWTALHIEGDRPHAGLPVSGDPARRDDGALVDDDDEPTVHFADEEPEVARWAPDDDHEPDLEEILESQHYAFPDEPADEEPGSDA
jgi:hypothetical protein